MLFASLRTPLLRRTFTTTAAAMVHRLSACPRGETCSRPELTPRQTTPCSASSPPRSPSTSTRRHVRPPTAHPLTDFGRFSAWSYVRPVLWSLLPLLTAPPVDEMSGSDFTKYAGMTDRATANARRAATSSRSRSRDRTSPRSRRRAPSFRARVCSSSATTGEPSPTPSSRATPQATLTPAAALVTSATPSTRSRTRSTASPSSRSSSRSDRRRAE